MTPQCSFYTAASIPVITVTYNTKIRNTTHTKVAFKQRFLKRLSMWFCSLAHLKHDLDSAKVVVNSLHSDLCKQCVRVIRHVGGETWRLSKDCYDVQWVGRRPLQSCVMLPNLTPKLHLYLPTPKQHTVVVLGESPGETTKVAGQRNNT